MRFLLIRLDGLGDTVLTTPLLRAIQEAFPDAAITFVASPVGALGLEGHPAIDRLLVVDPPRTTLRDKMALGRDLAGMAFDVALTVTEKAWGYLWTRMSGAPRRIGFWAGATQPVKSLMLGPTLTDRVPSPNDPSLPSSMHEAERHLRLLEPLGIRASAGPAWLAPLPAGAVPTPLDRVVLHLFPKWLTDAWTNPWLVEVARDLSAAFEGRLLLTAGIPEAAWAQEIAASIAKGATQILAGVPFAEWAAALAASKVVVSMDTGAVHVAAALGVPVVDVFPRAGAEHNVPRWKPWKVPHHVVLRGRGDDRDEASHVRNEIVGAARALKDACHVG